MIGSLVLTSNSLGSMELVIEHSNPCNLCGIQGIHACTGQPIPQMQEQERNELNQIMNDIFENSTTQPKPEVLIFADDRPSSIDNDLYQWALQAEVVIRKLQAENEQLVETVDALLQHCDDPECFTCGAAVCKYKEPLHFHHDGCPACADEQDLF